MTNAHEFNLDAELDQTTGWDDEEARDDAALDSHLDDDLDDDQDDDQDADVEGTDGDGFVSGYADDDDPELTTGELDLAERHELRRVAGLRTDLEDITEVEYRQLPLRNTPNT